MNWFTKSTVAARSLDEKNKLVAEWGGCEHVVADPSLLVAVNYENDTFGKEGYCLCKECNDQAVEEEMNESATCRDCHQSVKKKDGIEWKWYDFHAPQGDIPLFICNSCVPKERHQNRLAKDQADYEDEMAYYER